MPAEGGDQRAEWPQFDRRRALQLGAGAVGAVAALTVTSAVWKHASEGVRP